MGRQYKVLPKELEKQFLFHPDFHRRPWILTKSADLQHTESCGALAGLPEESGYRRWGISPRPEKYVRKTVHIGRRGVKNF